MSRAKRRLTVESADWRTLFKVTSLADLKRQGLGRALLEKIIRYCRAKGLQELVGEVLADNHAMLNLAQSLGFERHSSTDSEVVKVKLQLQEEQK